MTFHFNVLQRLRLNNVLNKLDMTTEERESKSAQWRTDNLGKNVGLANVVKPKGTFCQTPDNCQMSYYHQIGDYYCSKCEKTSLA